MKTKIPSRINASEAAGSIEKFTSGKLTCAIKPTKSVVLTVTTSSIQLELGFGENDNTRFTI